MEPLEEPLVEPRITAQTPTPIPTPTQGPPHEIFTYETTIWDADEDSFSAAGRRFFAGKHSFKAGDRIRISIEHIEGPSA